MGDGADLIMDGDVCAICGIYFAYAHGFPVLCIPCWDDCTKKEQEGYSKAHLEEV